MNNRIEKLERDLKRLRLYAFGLTGALGLLAVAAFRPGGGQEEILRARALVIVDEAGRERILLGAPIPHAENRVRTDPERVREAWAGRYPDPERYMGYYRDYRHDTNGLLILDENGFDRLALGDPVPDPNVGKRIGPSTGIVVNDEQGFERSGYGLLRVEDSYRVVLGLDSSKGQEGLVLALFDGGSVGVTVQAGEESIFLGHAPAGSRISALAEPFHGLLFREGSDVKRAISATKEN